MSKSQDREGVGTKAVRASLWLYGRRVLSSGVNLGVMVVLARTLSPVEFGLAALAQVLLRLSLALGAGGVSTYVLYDQDEGREARVNAAFWLNQTVALVLVSGLMLAAPLLSRTFDTPALLGLLAVLSASYFIDELGRIPNALIRRELDYKKIVVRDSALEFVRAFAALTMALNGYGVWSLVVPGLMIAPVRVLWTFVTAGWWPTLRLDLERWRRIAGYSTKVVGASLLSTAASEGDSLILGARLGQASLGIYNLAWQAPEMVARNAAGVFKQVAAPALARVVKDAARLRNGMKQLILVPSIVAFPPLMGLLAVAPEFVETLYGPKWLDAIEPMQILVLFAMRRTITSPPTAIYNMAGRPDIPVRMGIVFVPLALLCVYFATGYGVVGVALTMVVTRLLYGIVQLRVCAELAGMRLGELVGPLWRPLLIAVLMSGFVFALRAALNSYTPLPSGARLAVLVLSGAAVYLVLLRTAFSDIASHIVDLARRVSPGAARTVARLLNYG